MTSGAPPTTARRGLIALALAFVCTAGANAEQSDLDRLLQALAQRQHGHVPFVELKFIAVLERPLESSGELFYDAPDRLEKRTVKPRPERLVLERGVLSLQRGHRKYVLQLSEYPQIVPFIESIRATLAGDRAALERVFKVTFDGEFNHWVLTLVPLDAQLAGTAKLIHIEGTLDAIHSVEIADADGDRSVLTIGAEITQ